MEKTRIPFNIEHCGHCALRTKDELRGDRCYIFEVKDVSEDVEKKRMNEHCPLRKCEIVFNEKTE